MPRRIQTAAPGPARHTLACLGDSMTTQVTFGYGPMELWPERVAVALRDLGASVRSRSVGKGGLRTDELRDRVQWVSYPDAPTIAGYWGGINNLTQGTTGTIVADMTATLTDIIDRGCSRLFVIDSQFRNFSAGTASPDTVATPNATWAAMRALIADGVAAVQAARPTATVVIVPLYAAMRQRIVDGAFVAGDFAWHVADGNLHLNALGQQIVADTVVTTIAAQAGWLDALQAS